MGLLVNIDNGGTLTDLCAFDGERIVHAKTLTTPHDLSECLMTGLDALAARLGVEDDLVRFVASIDHLRYSTTHGTNAIVQRKGPRLGLLVSRPDQAASIREAATGLFDGLVAHRFAAIAGLSQPAIIQAVRNLISEGASRLVICLGDDAEPGEATLRRTLYAAFPRHLLGAVPLLFSGDLAPGGDPVRRGWSSLVNAFLHPSMEQFLHHAEERLRRHRARNPLLVFRNDGGSTRVSRTVALHTYSSGPRGGAVGAAMLARLYDFDRAISVDIGGTTTDLAMFEHGGVVEHRFGAVEGAPIAFPMADVRSVAAGGGSVLAVDRGRVTVGPESVGALPGPACFGRGGTSATLTDVMLLAGILDPHSYFGGRMVLDRDRAERAVRAHIAEPLGVDLDGAVAAAIEAYEAKVAAAIAGLADDAAPDAMIAFGGAGPMSACGIAEKAGIGAVLIPRLAAVFSAFGIGFSPVRHHHATPVGSFAADAVAAARAELEERAAQAMASEGFAIADCELRWSLLAGSGDEAASVPIDAPPPAGGGLVRLEVVRTIPSIALAPPDSGDGKGAVASGTRDALGGMPLYRLEELAPGDGAVGPCLVEEQFFTAWIRPRWRFAVTGNGDLLVTRQES